jgi:hypothetical protein
VAPTLRCWTATNAGAATADDSLAYRDAHPGADITFCSSDWIDESGGAMGLPFRRCHAVFSFSQLLEHYAVGNTSALVLLRIALARAGSGTPAGAVVKDADLVPRSALLRPDNIHAIRQSLTGHRRHAPRYRATGRICTRSSEALIQQFAKIAPEAIGVGGAPKPHEYVALLRLPGPPGGPHAGSHASRRPSRPAVSLVKQAQDAGKAHPHPVQVAARFGAIT